MKKKRRIRTLEMTIETEENLVLRLKPADSSSQGGSVPAATPANRTPQVELGKSPSAASEPRTNKSFPAET